MNKIITVVGIVIAIILVAKLNTVVQGIQYKDTNIVETFKGTGYFDSVVLTYDSTVGVGTTRSIEFTNDAGYLAIGIESANKLRLYEWNQVNSEYDVLIPAPSVAGLGSVFTVDFNDDDSVLAVGHSTVPYIKLYDVINNFDTITPDPDLTVDGIVYDLKYYEDEYLIVGGDMTNYIQVFKYDGTGNYVVLSNNIDVLPTNRVTDIDYNNGYLHISTLDSPYIITYKIDGDNLVKVSDPATLPTGAGNVIETSDNGEYLTVGHNVTPYVTMYKFENGVYTDVVLDVIPTQITGTLALHFIDNSYFYAGGDGSVYKYKLITDEFIQQTNDVLNFDTPVYVIDCSTVIGRFVLGDINDYELYTGTSEITFDNITLQHDPDRVNSVTQLGIEKQYILIDNIMAVTDEIYNRDIIVDYNYIVENENNLLEITPIFGMLGIILAVVSLFIIKNKRKR